MQVPHRIWLAANKAAPWPCARCDEPVLRLGGDDPDRRGIIHHHDRDRSNNALENLRVMHDLCHTAHHNKGSHRKLAAHLRDAIVSGAYAPGAKLPSIEAIIAETGLSPMTVRRAYGVLAAEGRVVVVPGRGTYAAGR